MRYRVEIKLDNDTIPKDKNKMILYLLKHCFSKYNEEFYKKLYEDNLTNKKDFTFSLFMNNCKFERDIIIVPDKKIYLNFSTYDVEEGIYFYNAILKNKNKQIPILSNNNMSISKIILVRENIITSEEIIAKVLSPIIVRSHTGDNKTTYFYSLNEEKGIHILKQNLKYSLMHKFGESYKEEIENIEIKVICNKEVKVKNYGIVVLGNLCKIKIHGKPFLLEYIYKAGIGSKTNSGFGMLEIC